MKQIREGTLLWKPNEKRKAQSNIQAYITWLHTHKGLSFPDYHSLWEWSVNEVELFWESIWEYFSIQSKKPYQSVLSSHSMPGASWFPEATVNYTEHIFRNRDWNKTAILHSSELRENRKITWGKLHQDTISLQHTLLELGVEKGDRVVAYIPNIYEAVVAFLATASLGAIWSSASPDFGTQSVIDRFQQIEPKIFITVDGYMYGGKAFPRLSTAKTIQESLPSLKTTITIPYLNQEADFSALTQSITWQDALQQQSEKRTLSYVHVAFNDPLWILFSSGTTGKPKAIVQSQGGILLEHLKALTFHLDLHEDDRFFWFTTTGWMMWNFLVGGLLTGSTIVLYDGNPAYPSQTTLWQLAEETKLTVFGTSASYITACMKGNIDPKSTFDLSSLKCIGSTGSPLPPEGFQWCYDHVKEDLWIASASGGTDVCTAFILGIPTLPVYAGELQCRGLGARIESYTDNGEPKIDHVGELVLTAPFPSMPIYFWNDPEGTRLQESYFDMFPGIWRHGDYLKITERGTCIIYGRSDATINRGGIRIGTSEIYRAVDHIKEIEDSLIVDIPKEDGDSFVPLFVQLKYGNSLTEQIEKEIKEQIRKHCSPRHVPTAIYHVPALPKTLNGKKLEVPIKKILMGHDINKVVNKDSINDPTLLNYFIDFAKTSL
ncbi:MULTISPECIES: acetoacetate--CoA ligase [unclassified Virgibacillus]|uniref:acetoacetate--CoA ligase n=1 Tax=unclassified Virgibacillus TaxID=2620237 RepID=UPI0024DE42B4|nr:acetoacetate--CoA ligase [Virgibacillus sp. LDC-1]